MIIIINIMIITRKPSTPEEIVLVLPLHACVWAYMYVYSCARMCTYIHICGTPCPAVLMYQHGWGHEGVGCIVSWAAAEGGDLGGPILGCRS